MNRIDRLFATVLYLADRGKVAADDLALYFGVSRRTVLRDLSAVQQAGVAEVAATAGPGGGYWLYKAPKEARLSPEESVAVYIASEAYRRRRDDPVTRALRAACVKVEAHHPLALLERVRHAKSRLLVSDGALARSAVGSRLFREALKALGERRVVRIRYRAADGMRTDREVSPYGLMLDESRWYLVGHDHLRGAVRVFRLDRIRRLESTEARTEVPREFDLEAVRRRYIRDMVEANPDHFTVRFAVPKARQRAVEGSWIGRLCEFQPLSQPIRMNLNGRHTRLDMEASYPETDEGYALRFLWELGPDLAVLAPETLRAAYLRTLRGAASFTEASHK